LLADIAIICKKLSKNKIMKFPKKKALKMMLKIMVVNFTVIALKNKVDATPLRTAIFDRTIKNALEFTMAIQQLFLRIQDCFDVIRLSIMVILSFTILPCYSSF